MPNNNWLAVALIVLANSEARAQATKPKPVPERSSVPTGVDSMLARVRSSIVRVGVVFDKGGTGWGTGFIINEDGTVVTVAHYLAHGAPRMFLVEMRLRGTHGNSTANFVTASATVVWEDTRRDISILKINEQAFKERTKFTVAQLDDAIRAEGEAVFIAGFPWGSKNTITSAGVLASLEPPSLDRPGREDVYLAAITSEVGNSGAPAFLASTGEVVGMVVGGISDRVWVDGKSGTYAWGEEVGPDNTTAKVQLDYASGLTEILPAFQITDLLRKRHIVYRSR